MEAEGEGMLSVSEGRQINTTKHVGGGVNVSAGATLLIKAGALSHTNSYTPHMRQSRRHAHRDIRRINEAASRMQLNLPRHRRSGSNGWCR